VRRHFAGRALSRRIIALAAAYAIALSSLFASFGAARAAAEATFNPLAIVCHHALGEQNSPADDRSNGTTCIDCCCVGCLMSLAALPLPPAVAAPAAAVISHRVVPVATAALFAARPAKSHRSRAPPA